MHRRLSRPLHAMLLEGGKLQVTPVLIVGSNPGGNLAPWQNEVLFILGVRAHVPF